MDFNLITNLQSCYVTVPSLLYYSHIPVGIIALCFGFFVFFKNRSAEAGALLAMGVFFSTWVALDLFLWASHDSRFIMFVWSFVNILENFVSVFTLYFVYLFLEKRDVLLRWKMFVAFLFLPFLALIPTGINLKGFDVAVCEATQGPIIYYFYFLEVFFFLWLLGFLLYKIAHSSGEERKKVVLLSVGSIFFLLSFSGMNILGSVTEHWEYLQYGLFGMPVFMGLLAYLIVRYQIFNIKLLAAQALVIGLSVLIGAQLFFIKTTTNYILTSVTFLLSIGFGILLIRSVKNEIRRKEELQVVTDKLAAANVELKRLDQSKTEFISIASHQLRTPLTAIKGFVSLLLEGSYGAVPAGIADILNKIYTSNERIIHLVEDLLNISRMEAGRLVYEYTEVNLCEFLNELRDTFAIAAKKKGLELSFECPEGEALPPVWIDRKKSFEVVSNLIDNAIKYTPKGSVRVRVERVSNMVRISVSDTGVGIAPEAIPRLFVKFTRGEESGKLYANGTGLGLYVGKSMMEAQGGTISVFSEGVNKGSTFSVDFPMKKG
jgi:signal transduction histidine kinase